MRSEAWTQLKQQAPFTAMGGGLTLWAMIALPVFLFLAVWVPCCTSDIVFPMFFAPAPSFLPILRHAAQRAKQKGEAA